MFAAWWGVMTRNDFALVSLILSLTGCIAAVPERGASELEDGEDEQVVSPDSPADDPYGYHDFTYEALGILQVANTVSEQELIDVVGINQRAAHAIAEWRAADRRFEDLETLDAMPRTGRSFFNHMRDYAESHGMVGQCGDGIVQWRVEYCDDSNTTSYDGCSDTCENEPSDPCHGRPTVCGDGLVCVGEVCDDGNTAGNDGCSAECTVIEIYSVSEANTTYATATDVPAGFHKVSGIVSGTETRYFTFHVTSESSVTLTNEWGCHNVLDVDDLAADGHVLATDSYQHYGPCSNLFAQPGTHTFAVHSHWPEQSLEDGVGDFVLNVAPMPNY